MIDHSVLKTFSSDPEDLVLALETARERAWFFGYQVRLIGLLGGVISVVDPPGEGADLGWIGVQ